MSKKNQNTAKAPKAPQETPEIAPEVTPEVTAETAQEQPEVTAEAPAPVIEPVTEADAVAAAMASGDAVIMPANGVFDKAPTPVSVTPAVVKSSQVVTGGVEEVVRLYREQGLDPQITANGHVRVDH